LPHSIASAGVGSIGYLIETGWSINRHIVVWGINLLMLALAFLLLKREVFVNTVIGSLAFPVLLALLPEIMLLRFYSVSLILGSFFFSFGIFSWQEALISAFSIYLIAFFMRFFMRIEQKTQAKKAVNVQETAELE